MNRFKVALSILSVCTFLFPFKVFAQTDINAEDITAIQWVELNPQQKFDIISIYLNDLSESIQEQCIEFLNDYALTCEDECDLYTVYEIVDEYLSTDDSEESLVWEVSTYKERVFYKVHGMAVWGHEFGFLKHLSDCSKDSFWLSFSSYQDQVGSLKGEKINFTLIIDDQEFEVLLPVINVGRIGLTNVVMMTNVELDSLIMESLNDAQMVNVKVSFDDQAFDLFDIKEDTFPLNGFLAAKQEAFDVCQSGSKEN